MSTKSDNESDNESVQSGPSEDGSVMEFSDDEHERQKKRKTFTQKDEEYDDSVIDEDEDDMDVEDEEEDDEDDEEAPTKIVVGDEDDDAENDEPTDDASDEDEKKDEESATIGRKRGSPSRDSNPVPLENVLFQQALGSDDEDDDESEDYLQKFDAELNKNYIHEFHPECLNHNSEEVAMLATVVRDATGIIVDPLHRTLPFLTKYEKARVLGQRAKQIEVGATPFVAVPESIVDGYLIAEIELKEKKIPFIIKRPIPGGAFEYWHLSDLENINF
jgi:DNA-directed RNA polymerase subunit K/omega